MPFIVAPAILLILNPQATAQNSPQDYINAHNKARAAVGVGPVTWDPTLEAYALNCANRHIAECRLECSSGLYGENFFGARGIEFNAGDVVNSWVSEKQYYDSKTNTCKRDYVCNHYTQVVWSKTTKIGCARVMCISRAILVICIYDPPGNTKGERPYENLMHIEA